MRATFLRSTHYAWKLLNDKCSAYGCNVQTAKCRFQGLNYLIDDESQAHPTDSYFMAYHTTLKVSKDYFEALRVARHLSANITDMLSEKLNSSSVEVFPYR